MPVKIKVEPRIVSVATRIALIQSTLTTNLTRINTLQVELSKLLTNNTKLADEQLSLQRELDKLSVGPAVKA